MKPGERIESSSPHCQSLVREIEEACGFEIQVRQQEEFLQNVSGPVSGNIFPNSPGSISDIDKAVIVYPQAENTLTDDDYHHELLHLHRKLVQRQPELVTAVEKKRQVAAYLDNQIEHMAIYAEQHRHSPSWRTKFIGENRGFWQNYPPRADFLGRPVDPDTVRFLGIQRYFIVKEYGTPGLADYAKGRLSKATQWQYCHAAYRQLKGVWPEKLEMVKICLDAANEPYGDYLLQQIDVTNQARLNIAIE